MLSDNYIKAPEGKVLRAYVKPVWGNTSVERALIDQYGLVFILDRGGWSTAVQDNKHYKITTLPNPIKMWDGFKLWDYWWEAKAWKDPAWGWLHFKANKDD